MPGSGSDRFAGYSREVVDAEEDLEDDQQQQSSSAGQQPAKRSAWSAPKEVLDDVPVDEFQSGSEDPFARKRTIADREDSYHARRHNRILSPERADAFGDGSKKGGSTEARSFSEVMRDAQLDRERQDLVQKIIKKTREDADNAEGSVLYGADGQQPLVKKRRWDSGPAESEWESAGAGGDIDGQPMNSSRWDETPRVDSGLAAERSSRWDETPRVDSGEAEAMIINGADRRSRWDQTPVHLHRQQEPAASQWSAATTPSMAAGEGILRKQRSRWDETPVVGSMTGGETPAVSSGSQMYDSLADKQKFAPPGTAEAYYAATGVPYRIEQELDVRNRPWTASALDALLPSEGYKIVEPPASYVPVRAPARKLTAAPEIEAAQEGFFVQQEQAMIQMQALQPPEAGGIAGGESLPFFKPADIQFFGKLLDNKDEDDMSLEEAKERKIMRLLLRIKNGTPDMRKVSMKQITQKARDFGAGPLFNQILPLLMSPTLEEQERHLLVKVIDRILYKLDDLVRPYVHKILVVIEPLLIDEDYYARVEGREIISNLSKAAGLATMIATMRPDIDHVDEYVRNTTARAFSVVASALGIPALIPFLKAVCKSKKSWQARHTGIKIVQQIAILMGCAVLPHLRQLVEAIGNGLEDEQQKVRTMAALAIAALAEASAPYGIESFESVLRKLWEGTHKHRGKGLAAFLKAIGFIIPLMDPEYANKYTREIMKVLIREFQTPDEEMKKIVLKVIKQCSTTEGVESDYIRTEILPDFFKHFWIRRMSLDRRNYRQLVETTVALAQKVGVSEIVTRLVDKLKDESEPFRKMTLETIKSVVSDLGTADVDDRLEELLIDGLLFAFQEQTTDDTICLDSFGVVVNSLGLRTKPYLPHICSTILWRLNNKTAKVRQQAADLVGRIAHVMHICGEEKLLAHLGQVLYEYLGEEFPDVLGSILAGLKGIVNVIGMAKMNPPIKDLLPRLTPILKNRHEKVQENCIDLVGRIADRGAEFVSAREWMRICFELLDTLKAQKKAIRRAAVNTFGYIAKAIGPQDVLATLLSNLKVQERQLRVCTTVAIAIVAETCAPFTVLPALMNEYRVPERNVQNGVLKSLSFMFEYIGEMSRDYIYSLTTLLEDALMDRDAVHRQTACAAIKHLSIGCFGLSNEDALHHLLNYVWPNVFEGLPHVINAVMEAIEGLRLALGPCVIMQYLFQGLFHPARKVRDMYWKIYNSMYLGAQDAMVPFYPRVENDDRNQYERHELDYVL